MFAARASEIIEIFDAFFARSPLYPRITGHSEVEFEERRWRGPFFEEFNLPETTIV
jgi:hypothetical protein